MNQLQEYWKRKRTPPYSAAFGLSTSEAAGLPRLQDVRFKESYKLKLAICKNPNTPQRTVFSLLKLSTDPT
jgi:hypothetical protein